MILDHIASRSLAPTGLIVIFTATLLGLAVGPVGAQDADAPDADAPAAASDAFEASGDAAGADVVYEWTVREPDGRWFVALSGPADEQVEVRLTAGDGSLVDRSRGTGAATLHDLALQPGDYQITVSRSSRESLPFALEVAFESERFDPEPNDSSSGAVPISDGSANRGRLARTGSDADRYVLMIPSGEPSIRDVELTTSSEADRMLCLLDADDRQRHCRRGTGGVTLRDLVLEPGPHVFEVSGSTAVGDPYQLAVGHLGPRTADVEAEPNDDYATASDFDAALGVKGHSSRGDPDFHVVTIEGEPQRWRVVASGPQVDALSLVRGGRAEVARSNPPADGTDAVLEDLVLAPGAHVFRVRTLGDDYEIAMTPLGPVDPEAEREPNNDDVRANAFVVGEAKTGRLPTSEDIDFYRFTLADFDRIRLTLEQPADADIDVTLVGGGDEATRQRAPEPGGLIDLDLALPPGDYLLRLRPRQPSEGTYRLAMARLDPFQAAADQEPNDELSTARPAPRSLVVRGDRLAGEVDVDWFELPPLATPSTVRIDHSEARPVLRLFAGSDAAERLSVDRPEDGVFIAEAVPAGVPLYLQLEARGPYEARLSAPGWSPMPDPVNPDVEIDIAVDEPIVAAYWPEGQRVAGKIAVTNNGTEGVELSLLSASSHYGWEAVPEVSEIAVAAGMTIEVPLEILILSDAWADAPVQLSVAASTADGGLRSATTTMDAARDAPPVGSHRAWPVPDALLGGLNVAGLALGGQPLGSIDADREAFLFDDVTPAEAGFRKGSLKPPVDLVVDLAGEAPVPIRGIILNPLAAGSHLAGTPRRFEILLSTDGDSWDSALEGELSPLPIDQSFVLDEPISATHALLRIHSMHRQSGAPIALGEWKVVAEPGAVPDPMPRNIAAPVRGGHVARHAPYAGNMAQWAHILDVETKRNHVAFVPDEDDRLDIIIAFQEGRAAQVTELRWADPEGTDEEIRAAAVDVSLGLDGPLGPWQEVGTWTLDRAADGSVVPFDLGEPRWARFVRLTAPLPEGKRVEFPATVEVIERATDDEYRSILGEWGYTSNRGPYEQLVPDALAEIELGPDPGDTPGEATPLEPGVPHTDQAEILEDVDWYRVEVPAGHNTLSVEVDGVPTVGVNLAAFDASGEPLEMRLETRPGGINHYEAVVEPGGYDLLVEQPPFNAVFTFDTSGSMGPFLDFVFEGMREFAADVEPGREAVHIVPFSRPPLLDAWQDQPILLEDAVNSFVPHDESSNVEEGLLASAELLAGRDGARAILAVADAETGSLALAPEVWRAFDEVQPIVYTVHVGASGSPEETRNLMRAWADSAGGVYNYPTTHSEMDRAFERMSTRLRRPATYTLLAQTTAVDRDPAQLRVEAAAGTSGTALAPGVGVEVILDTSGSMREKLGGQRRIDIAKASLRSLFSEALQPGVPVAVRTFGGPGKGKKAQCATRLSQPLAPLDRAKMLRLVKKTPARKSTRTPIGAAIEAVAGDLADVSGPRTVVLVTDGDETCGGDPDAAIQALRDQGIDVNLNIVGFALEDADLKARMAGWASAGEGTYFDAAVADELAAAIVAAVSAPFRVYVDDSDEPIAGGTIGGGPVTLDPGSYRVEVLVDPVVVFERVVIEGGRDVSLVLPDPVAE